MEHQVAVRIEPPTQFVRVVVKVALDRIAASGKRLFARLGVPSEASSNDRDSRRLVQSGAGQSFRRHVPAKFEHRFRRVVRQPEGVVDPCHSVYPALAQLPEAPDIVVVFRRVEELLGVAAEAVAVGAHTFWTQLGLWSDEAAKLAHEAGLFVVMNRCIKIEHARFAGGLHLAGFDTGGISSKRLGSRRPVPPASSGPG